MVPGWVWLVMPGCSLTICAVPAAATPQHEERIAIETAAAASGRPPQRIPLHCIGSHDLTAIRLAWAGLDRCDRLDRAESACLLEMGMRNRPFRVRIYSGDGSGEQTHELIEVSSAAAAAVRGFFPAEGQGIRSQISKATFHATYRPLDTQDAIVNGSTVFPFGVVFFPPPHNPLRRRESSVPCDPICITYNPCAGWNV